MKNCVKKYIILKLVHLLLLLREFNFCVYKSPPLVPKLSYINPVHAFPFYFWKIRFNIIPPSTFISSIWAFPSGFLTKKLLLELTNY